MYPYYFAAFIVLFLYQNRHNLLPIPLLQKFCDSLPELLFLQNLGIFNGGINYPLWQLCVLIFVCHIWFALLNWNERVTVHVLCPVFAVSVITYLANTYNTHTVDIFTVESKFFYVPLFRAGGFVGLGIFLNKPITDAVRILQSLKHKNIVISLLGIGASWVFFSHQWDYISYIAFVLILICCLSNHGILTFLLNRRIFSIGEKLSLSIYMNHAFIIYVLQDTLLQIEEFQQAPSLLINALFVVILISFSFLFIRLVDFIQQAYKK